LWLLHLSGDWHPSFEPMPLGCRDHHMMRCMLVSNPRLNSEGPKKGNNCVLLSSGTAKILIKSKKTQILKNLPNI
jgi:hypothetical protein